MVPRHPSLQSTRTRRPGAGNFDSGSLAFTPFHQSTTYSTPFCGLSPPCGPCSICPLSKDAPPDWAVQRFNSPLQATAAATGNGHSGRHTLGKTSTTPFAFKDSERTTVGIYQWFGLASWPFKASHQFSGLDKRTMALALDRDSSLT